MNGCARKGQLHASATIAAAIIVIAISSCSGPLLRPLLEGTNGSAWAGDLAIHPSAVTVVVGTQIQFTATGGDGTYLFAVATGTGSIDAHAGTYQAPLTAGIEQVTVSDSRGNKAQAQVSVTATGGAYPDYTVASSPSAVFPSAGTGGASFSGSFSVQNIAVDPGTTSVLWSVYLSSDATLGAGDLLSDSGSIGALGPGAVSSSVAFAGTWPSAGGNYYLIIVVSAPDDLVVANNQLASGAIAVTGLPAPDYSFVSVTAPSTAVAGTPLSVPLAYTNASTSAGTAPVTWEAYYSSDATIDAGDQLIATGTASALAGGGSATPTATGTWPSIPGTGYVIGRVSAVDDGSSANNLKVSSPITITVPDIDYAPTAPSAPAAVTVNDAINESFTLQNIGSQAGSATVSWSVYASPGNQTVGDPGDVLVASGTQSALGGTSSQVVNFSGTWSVPSGSYYLVVDVSASDDFNTGNDITASASPTTVSAVVPGAPDYQVTAFPAPSGTIAGNSVNGTFTVTNNGTAAGSNTVYWAAYASLNDATYNSGDVLIASGSFGALGVGLTNSPPYNGVWPASAGTYYVVVVVQAADDSTNGTGASPAVTVAPPDVNYQVSTMNVTAGTLMPDQPVSGTFQYRNAGTTNGTASQTVDWEVYASANTTIDSSDSLIASGSGLAALSAGSTSSDVAWSGVWPLDYGTYYVLIRVTAGEDVNSTDNDAASSSSYAVGYFTESEPNDDWNTLVPAQIDIPGVTLKPGMSIQITGSMSNSDIDDVFQFDTGTATVVIASVSYGAPAKSISLYIFNGPGASLGNAVGITATDLSLQWTVDSAQCWIDFENTGTSNLGAYTLIVSAY